MVLVMRVCGRVIGGCSGVSLHGGWEEVSKQVIVPSTRTGGPAIQLTGHDQIIYREMRMIEGEQNVKCKECNLPEKEGGQSVHKLVINPPDQS